MPDSRTQDRAAQPRRALLFRYALLAEDVAAELTRLGVEVHWLTPKTVTLRDFEAACAHLQPDFVFTINFSPEIALLASHARRPYLSWTIDPLPAERLRLHLGTDPNNCLAFAHRRALVEALARLGLPNVGHLPLAAAARRCEAGERADELQGFRCDASFVGNSLADDGRAFTQALREMGADSTAVAMWQNWAAHELVAHQDGVTYEGIEPHEPNAALLSAPLDRLDSARLDLPRLIDAANGRLAQLWRERVVRTADAALRAVTPPLRFAVWGDAGWVGAAGEAYRGVAQHGEVVSRIYAASRVNLDVPRIYQRDIVTLRVFDVLACGGLVLTEPSADLTELFTDGEHLVTYTGLRELARKVTELARDPARCAELGARGREHVLRHHQLSQRVRTLLDAVVERPAD